MKSNSRSVLTGNETLLLAKKIACMMLFVSALVTLFIAEDVYADTLTLKPDSDGHENDYSPGTDNFALINDSDLGTYIFVAKGKQEDYWGIENHTTESGNISNVTVHLTIGRSSGGESFRVKLYTYGTEHDNGFDKLDSVPYTDYSHTWNNLNPDTGLNWTWTEIDNLEIGIGSEAVGGWPKNEQQRVAEAWVVVDYVPSLDYVPQWDNATINDTKVYTGESVNHSAEWADESLGGFIFSWNASGNCDSDTWVNATWQPMTGTSNISFNISTIPNACANKTIGWMIYANDTKGQWNATDIRTYDVTGYGWLDVFLDTPSALAKKQNNTFWINATVTCEGPPGAECGNINGSVKYNETSDFNTLINTTPDTPFHITGGLANPLSCPTDLNQSNSCQLGWIVNATGGIDETYKIDVNFSSSFGNDSVRNNDTEDSTVTIVSPYGWLNVTLLPFNSSNWVQNQTYWVNATVTCEGKSW
ncbi:MAG: hypothetical protein ACYS1A_18520, partial [Planctomycetota bacterium]